MIKQYKIGMTCRKHGACDIINARHSGEVAICTYKHLYEVYNKTHHYDLVFNTVNLKQYNIREKS